MNDLLASLCVFAFLALPPVLLVIRFTTHKPAWWLIVMLALVLGWILVAATYVFHHQGINDLIAQGKYDDLPDGWDSDGASGLMALFGGWFFSIVYLAPWLVVYGLAAGFRRLLKSRRSGTPPHAANAERHLP